MCVYSYTQIYYLLYNYEAKDEFFDVLENMLL